MLYIIEQGHEEDFLQEAELKGVEKLCMSRKQKITTGRTTKVSTDCTGMLRDQTLFKLDRE